MLHITRKGDYAIRGMVYLAMQPAGQVALLSRIAAEVDAPASLLAKVFQQLGKVGLVQSWRGTGGGFTLGRAADAISLLEIVEALEGPIVLNRCLWGRGICDRENFCPVHPVWQQLQGQIRGLLRGVTLAQLAGGRGDVAPKDPLPSEILS